MQRQAGGGRDQGLDVVAQVREATQTAQPAPPHLMRRLKLLTQHGQHPACAVAPACASAWQPFDSAALL